jgi:hypothetical protein
MAILPNAMGGRGLVLPFSPFAPVPAPLPRTFLESRLWMGGGGAGRFAVDGGRGLGGGGGARRGGGGFALTFLGGLGAAGGGGG